MRSSSYSSSRSPSPQNFKRKSSGYVIINDIIKYITIFITLALVILIPYIIISTLKNNCKQYTIHISFICSLLFHFLMVIQDLIKPEKHSFFTIWYNIHFHYFINNMFIYYSRLNIFPYFVSVGSRSLFALFKNLDDIYSDKTGNMSKFILSFTKPVINSIQLHRFAAILEILEMPYLIISVFIASKSLKILTVLSVNAFFLLMCYQTEPYHKWVWQSIRKFLTNRGHKHRDSFGPILFAIVSIFDFCSDFAQFLFPPVKSS